MPSVTVVTGPRGSGRSALVRYFAGRVEETGEGLALFGEAHAGVHVPFRGADGLAASLSASIQGLSWVERGRILSGEIAIAARMLPALRRVRDIAEERRKAPRRAESAELRDRGFAALAELFRRLAERRPVAVVIDDLDGRDDDADALLSHVFWPARSPPAVAVIATAPTLADARLPHLEGALEPRHVDLGALAPEEAESLALSRLEALGADASRASEIARRAAGYPGDIEARARAASEGAEPPEDGDAAGVARARIRRLSGGPRRVLEMLAACDLALPRPVVARAAELGRDADAVLTELEDRGFIDRCEVSDRDGVRLAERAIRDGALADLDEAARAERHMRVAEQLDLYGDGEAAAVAAGLARAGAPESAARRALVAARQAREQLAFARAADLYESALELGGTRLDGRRAVRVELAEVSAHLGRRRAAAGHFARAAERAPPREAVRLRGRAAEQYAVAREMKEALELGELALGVDVPARAARRAPARLARRANARSGGRRQRRRGAEAVELARIDICWGLGLALATSDPERAQLFHREHAQRALRDGEPGRVALALSTWAAGAAGRGEGGRRRAAELTARATELARESHDAYALAFVEHAAGIRALELGAWDQALEHALRARSLLGEASRLRSFEALAIAVWEPVALYYTGAWGELRARREELARTARERGDACAELWVATGHAAVAELAASGPGRARALVRRAREAWPGHPAPIAHADAFASAHIDLYEGTPGAALGRMDAEWHALRDSPLFRQRRVRIEVLGLRALCELGAAAEGRAEGKSGARQTDAAMRTARQLARQRTPPSSALSQLVRAGAFAVRGEDASAASWLRAAESSLERVSMTVHAAAARRRRGELLGDSGGEALVASADRVLTAAGVADPARIAAMLVPAAPGHPRAAALPAPAERPSAREAGPE